MALKLSVIGVGYLGATHAACMSSLGFDVIGVDTDQSKVNLLSEGELPFYEPGLDTLLASEIKTGRLRFTTNFVEVADAVTWSDKVKSLLFKLTLLLGSLIEWLRLVQLVKVAITIPVKKKDLRMFFFIILFIL